MSKIKAETSTENGFKETGIGLIPEDWGIKKISDIAEIKYGKQKPREKGLIPVVGSSGTYDFCRKELVNFPTLIIGRKGNAGSVQLLLLPCWPADTTFYMNWKSKNVDEKFLYYYMSLKPLSGEHAKTTMPSLQRQDLEEYQFPFLPSNEQQKISSVLSKIQQAIEQQDKIIEKTKELKRSLMQKLFTEGLRGEELKETEIGLMPKSWQIKSISEIADKFLGGGTPSTKIQEYWNGNIHWTTSKRLRDKLYLFDGERLITEKGLNNSSTNLIPKGNLLVSTRVTVGKVAINKTDIAISQDLTGLILSKEICNVEFVAYQMQIDRIQQIFYEQKRGATIKGITREDLKKIRLAIPNIAEQRGISSIFLTLDSKIFQEESKKQYFKDLFKSMLNNLMTGQVRVKDIDFREDYE